MKPKQNEITKILIAFPADDLQKFEEAIIDYLELVWVVTFFQRDNYLHFMVQELSFF